MGLVDAQKVEALLADVDVERREDYVGYGGWPRAAGSGPVYDSPCGDGHDNGGVTRKDVGAVEPVSVEYGEIADRYPDDGIMMRLVDLDEQTGEFSAVRV